MTPTNSPASMVSVRSFSATTPGNPKEARSKRMIGVGEVDKESVFLSASSRTAMPYRWRLGSFQGVGQLDHIITKHVEIGVGPRQAPGKRRQDDHTCTRFPGQEFRQPLAQLNLGDDRFHLLFFYGRDQLLNVDGGRFTCRLRLYGADDLKAESSREIGPGWMVGNETPVAEMTQTIGQVGSQ